jgi:thiamine biosynthesis protein ThiS
MATIKVNGKEQDLKNPATIAELLIQNNVSQPDMVSVQLNGEFVYRQDYEIIALKDGDEIDFLYFMGGGEKPLPSPPEETYSISFSEEQIVRYSRHILLQDVGVEGQEKISAGKVLIVGAGGLGSPAALYLAAAGVGTIGIIDGDVVDLSNLQRQIIHFTQDVNKPKALSAKEKIHQLNPDVNVVTYQTFFTSDNAFDIIKDYDFVVDGTDNFPVKFLINDACVMAGKAFSHGGILRFDGQTFTHTPGNACYRCLFHSPPPPNAVPTCSQAGVLGAIAGMLGTIQTAETLKYLTGVGELLTNKLLSFDAKTMEFRTVKVRRSEHCPVCGSNPTITELIDYEQATCELKS